MERLSGQVTIITGAGRGIGKGIARCFAEQGATVIIASRGYKAGKETEQELNEAGGKALFIQTDVASEESIKQMVEETYKRFGRIDTLINNAGITIFKSIEEATIDDWEKLINIDLRGPFLCSKYVLPYMKERKSGSIINISSNHAVATLPHTEIYAAAKGGVNALTRSLALSVGGYGIRVNAICPGFTNTPHYEQWLSEVGDVEDEVKKLHAVGRIAEPEDIGKFAIYLSTDDSSMLTGESIVMDGGLSARLYHSETF